MFSFFKKKFGGGGAAATPTPAIEPTLQPAAAPESRQPDSVPAELVVQPPAPAVAPRQTWLDKLRQGLRKTGSSIAQVFTGTQIDDALYEELEAALLMADAGVKATEFLLEDMKRRVKEAKATEPAAVRGLLVEALSELLKPLEKSLSVGEASRP